MTHIYEVYADAPTGRETVTVSLPGPVQSMDDWVRVRQVASAVIGAEVRVVGIRPLPQETEGVAA